jgi:hypothetical protein
LQRVGNGTALIAKSRLQHHAGDGVALHSPKTLTVSSSPSQIADGSGLSVGVNASYIKLSKVKKMLKWLKAKNGKISSTYVMLITVTVVVI